MPNRAKSTSRYDRVRDSPCIMRPPDIGGLLCIPIVVDSGADCSFCVTGLYAFENDCNRVIVWTRIPRGEIMLRKTRAIAVRTRNDTKRTKNACAAQAWFDGLYTSERELKTKNDTTSTRREERTVKKCRERKIKHYKNNTNEEIGVE